MPEIKLQICYLKNLNYMLKVRHCDFHEAYSICAAALVKPRKLVLYVLKYNV